MEKVKTGETEKGERQTDKVRKESECAGVEGSAIKNVKKKCTCGLMGKVKQTRE